jgi:hypothetical protein
MYSETNFYGKKSQLEIDQRMEMQYEKNKRMSGYDVVCAAD